MATVTTTSTTVRGTVMIKGKQTNRVIRNVTRDSYLNTVFGEIKLNGETRTVKRPFHSRYWRLS